MTPWKTDGSRLVFWILTDKDYRCFTFRKPFTSPSAAVKRRCVDSQMANEKYKRHIGLKTKRRLIFGRNKKRILRIRGIRFVCQYSTFSFCCPSANQRGHGNLICDNKWAYFLQDCPIRVQLNTALSEGSAAPTARSVLTDRQCIWVIMHGRRG